MTSGGARGAPHYVCRAGGATECGTLILSVDLDRLKQDPAAAGQHWYCKCGAKYKTTFGVLLDVIVNLGVDSSGAPTFVSLYCRGEFPPQGILDAKLPMVEERAQNRFNTKSVEGLTPKDARGSLPVIRPLDTGAL